jgi:hypothetical protein
MPGLKVRDSGAGEVATLVPRKVFCENPSMREIRAQHAAPVITCATNCS